MAVEKMKLVNIMGRLDHLDDFLEDIIEIDELDQVSALMEIQNRDFSIKASEENIDRIEDFNELESFPKTDDETISKLEDIKQFLDIGDKKGGHRIAKKDVDEIYSKLSSLIARKKELENKKATMESYLKNYEILNSESIDINKIQKLKYFNYRFGEINKEGRFILKNNYENIPSTIIHLRNDHQGSNSYKEYIDEIISIDESTVELRNKTDELVQNEKDNVRNVFVSLNKEYEQLTKDKSKDVYDSIISEADYEAKAIEENYKGKSLNTKKIFDENEDSIVEEFVDKIKKL